MVLDNKPDPNSVRTNSDRLVSYSFDGLTQKNVVHLLNRGQAQPGGAPGEQIEASAAGTEPSGKSRRTGKLLLAFFVIGILGFFIGLFIPDDLRYRAAPFLKSLAPVFKTTPPAPAAAPAPAASAAEPAAPVPVTADAAPVPPVPAAASESPVSPVEAKPPQPAPAPAAEVQKQPRNVADECSGPRLALGLCRPRE